MSQEKIVIQDVEWNLADAEAWIKNLLGLSKELFDALPEMDRFAATQYATTLKSLEQVAKRIKDLEAELLNTRNQQQQLFGQQNNGEITLLYMEGKRRQANPTMPKAMP
jgi:hypothetical protein